MNKRVLEKIKIYDDIGEARLNILREALTEYDLFLQRNCKDFKLKSTKDLYKKLISWVDKYLQAECDITIQNIFKMLWLNYYKQNSPEIFIKLIANREWLFVISMKCISRELKKAGDKAFDHFEEEENDEP